MSNVINFTKGERLSLSGKVYKFFGRTKNGYVQLEDPDTGEIISKTDNQLMKLWTEGELIRVKDSTQSLITEKEKQELSRLLSEYPQHILNEINRRWHYLSAVRVANPPPRSYSEAALGPIICEAAANDNSGKKPPSARRVSEWARLMMRHGRTDGADLRWLAPRYYLRGNAEPRFDPEVVGVIDDQIEVHYMRRNPQPVTKIFKFIKDIVLRMAPDGKNPIYMENGKLRFPSLPTVRKYIRQLPLDEVMRAQKGSEAMRRLCIPVLKGSDGKFPLNEVEVDHHLLDIVVVDHETRLPIGRPWLTLLLDRKSRMVVGMHIGFEPPSFHTVALALKNAIGWKDDLLAKFPDIIGEWPCYGMPVTLFVDNGSEFHGEDFKIACQGLGIEVVFCAVRRPQQKGKIERLFRRIEEDLIHQLPGTTRSNPEQRGDYDAVKNAAITLEALWHMLVKWLVMVYSVSEHRGIGDIPLDAWKAGVADYPVRLPDDIKDLDILLTRTELRSLTRKGIEIFNMRYNKQGEFMQKLINRADKPEVVRVKYNPDNLGSVWVLDWRSGTYFELPCVDQEYAQGLSLREHGVILARAKARLKERERVTFHMLMAARREFHDQVKQLIREKRFALSKRIINAIGTENKRAGGERLDPGAAVNTTITGTESFVATPAVDLSADNEDLTMEDLDALAAKYGITQTDKSVA
ncbi:MAG: DDE-type integrase/transposase/recombinase [Ferrovibrio sp.]|uniref:Mu transposase C-terminal domain-containing protein n=1 Tax=Ferrovibrio sp. TaxID=1917215 RepID=UPI002616A022|nr:Mu transposase C-terminal domain-containing protein [Ferrovibrio sp.]MCW0236302.1 DDE-type integrase/transposase/recombinase [Ferrovibrio sp.]